MGGWPGTRKQRQISNVSRPVLMDPLQACNGDTSNAMDRRCWRIVANPSVTAICLTSGACKKLFGQDLVFEHEVPANITVGVLALFAQDNPLRDRDAALEQNSSMIWQS